MTNEEVYALLARTGALLEGHFELRSGLHSDRFFQCANALRYPAEAEALCGAAVATLPEALRRPGAVDAVIAPALGGLVVGHEVARALGGIESIFAEKQDGKLVMRRFGITPGRRYIVAEDVITRGGRVQETIDIVTGQGGTVAAIVLLVDRSNGSVTFPYPTYSLLRMAPTVWAPAECPLCRQGSKAVHPGS